MAFDAQLGDRIREVLAAEPGLSERKMFGGLAFMLSGNMCCGVIGEELMVRVGPDAYEESLARPEAREMDFTGKALKGMVYVGADAIAVDEVLTEWVNRGIDFAGDLPPK